MSEIKTASLKSILMCQNAGDPMEFFKEVEAVEGWGIRSGDYLDRYGSGKGAFSNGISKIRGLSIIAFEAIRSAYEAGGPSPMPIDDYSKLARRNLVIQGLGADLEYLIGSKMVTSSGVVLEISGPCAPCKRPEKLALKLGLKPENFETRFGFGHGGVRANVIGAGCLKLGDILTVET